MYTQDQINAVCRSYLDEIIKLLEVKASQALTIQDLRNKNAALTKENEAYKKELIELKPAPQEK